MLSDSPTSITMQDVADASGVSRMTVSRALKDNPRLSKATRERVQQIARDLGYRPHPYVSALMSRLSQTREHPAAANLAVFHFDTLAQTLRHNYYHGVLAQARALGFKPDPFLYDPWLVPPGRLRKILMARGIRAIILMPANAGFTSVDFDFSGFAAVSLGLTICDPPMPRVTSDPYSGTFRALEELTKRGYRRIGMINTDYVNRLARFLYTAALLAYRTHVNPQLHLVEHILLEPAGSEQSHKLMKRWILREKLDAVICPLFEFPLHSILVRQGFDIPGRLGYVHLFDYPDPNVSCMESMARLIGAKSVNMVAEMINRNEFRQSHNASMLAIPPEWREGTTAPERGLPPKDSRK